MFPLLTRLVVITIFTVLIGPVNAAQDPLQEQQVLQGHSHGPSPSRLSQIQSQDISANIRYYQFSNETLPENSKALRRLLPTLLPLNKPNNYGDRFIAVIDVYNDTQERDWFVRPYGSVIQNITIASYGGLSIEQAFSGYGQQNQIDFQYGSSMDIAVNSHRTLVVLFDSDFFFAPIKIVLEQESDAVRTMEIENMAMLFCLGIGLALGVYNLFIFIGSGDRTYLYYAVATLTYNWGWAHVFGVIEKITQQTHPNLLMAPYVLGAVFTALFAQRFLHLKEYSSSSHMVLTGVAALSALFVVPATFSLGLGVELASVTTGTVLVVCLISGINVWYKGYKPAGYFVLAFMALLIPNMVGNLINLGVLPRLNVNVYLLGLIGNTLDSLLLAFALAEKVRLVNRQNTELRESLEQKVTIRTQELSEVNEQLRQSNQSLFEANNAKSAFVANMSHEIRTPLTSIIGYADGVLMGDINIEEQERVLNIISKNGNHLLSVIDDILDLSKIEANKLDYEFTEVPLFSILSQVESVIGKRAGDKGLKLVQDYQFPLPSHIISDPTRLRQILFNLTNNAIKFTQRGRIKLSVQATETELHITVRDTGIGIAPEKLGQLFSAFTQADSSISRQYGGTGLGLSISEKLARGLNGSLTATSELGQGSAFKLKIKLQLADNNQWIQTRYDALQSAPSKTAKVSELPDFDQAPVLLADDNHHNRELFTRLLKRMNIDVTEVSNGRQAIEAVEQKRFRLILMDIQMPELDGLQALKLLRSKGVKAPIIALTANTMQHEIESYLQQGFNNHLAKPMVRDVFIETMMHYLPSKSKQNVLEDDEMLPLVTSYYENTLRPQMGTLGSLWSQRQFSQLVEVTHSIKGAAATFGFPTLGSHCANIEKTCKQWLKTPPDDEQIAALQPEIDALLGYISQHFSLEGINIPQGIVRHELDVDNFVGAIRDFFEVQAQPIRALSAKASEGSPKQIDALHTLTPHFEQLGFQFALGLSEQGLHDLTAMEDVDSYSEAVVQLNQYLAQLQQRLSTTPA